LQTAGFLVEAILKRQSSILKRWFEGPEWDPKSTRRYNLTEFWIPERT